jgi:YD repeat-containing protein
MKKITTITIAALSLLTLFSACKKETVNSPEPAQRKLVKVELTGSGTNTNSYTYNTAGRLIERKHNSFTHQYDYSASVFLQTTFDNSTSKKTYEVNVSSVAGEKVAGVNYISFKTDGSINYTEPHTFQYNSESYLTGRSYGTYNYVNEYTAGNLTKSSGTKSGAAFSEFLYEYYTDKTNNFNINWLEHTFQSQFLNDKELFGKRNKNLLKKVSNLYATGNSYGYEFTYTFDASGYITNCTATESTNGVTSAVYNYEFFYQ